MCCTGARKAEKERRLYGSIVGACAATTPVPLPLRHQSATSTIATPSLGRQYHCHCSATRTPPLVHQYHCHCHQRFRFSSVPHCNQKQWKKRQVETWDRVCDQANLPGSQPAPVKTVWSPALVSLLRCEKCFNQKEYKSGKHGYEEGRKYCCRGARRG